MNYYGWDYLRKALARILTCWWFEHIEIGRKHDGFGKRVTHMKRILRRERKWYEKLLDDL